MRVAIDTNVFLALRDGDVPISRLDGSGEPVDDARERLEQLLNDLDERKGKLLVFAGVLAEAMVGVSADRQQDFLDRLRGTRWLEVIPFDEPAAITLGRLTVKYGKPAKGPEESRQKVKVDCMLIAAAIRFEADVLVTADRFVRDTARAWGLQAYEVVDLPLPTEPTLPFDQPDSAEPPAGDVQPAP